MNKKHFIFGILFLLTIVGAIQITNFDGFSSPENLTFTGNENITRNITLYKDANITDAIMNLSGNEFINYSNQYSTGDYSASTLQQCAGGLCINRSRAIQGNVTINSLTIDNMSITLDRDSWDFISGNISFKIRNSSNDAILSECNLGEANSTLNSLFFTKYSCDFSNDLINNKVYFTFERDDISQGIIDIISDDTTNFIGNSYTYNNDTGNWDLHSSTKDWTMEVYFVESPLFPTNTSVKINNTNIWSYVGKFNSTFSPNQTDDFSSTLNTALNGGACDCTGCTLSGDNCTINFTFHSDTAGILEYSNIDINWLEYTNPNLTINKPTGEYSTTQIPYNVSVVDNWETDFCTYWVMRGASLEVANTTVTCSDEITGNLYVSSQNTNYVFHFFVNDTSGNSNKSTSNFSTAENATVVYAPSGGGGSSSSIIINAGATWTMEAGRGQGSFDSVNLIRGTSQTREILFENIGDESRTIELSCEDEKGSVCKFVTFETEKVELPLIQDLKTRVDFTITATKETELGEYVFNIVGIDDENKKARITVNLEIKEAGFFSKLSSRTEGGTPYILIAIISFILGAICSSVILSSSKSKIKPLLIILISSSITYVAVIII